MAGINLNKKLWRIPQQGMVRGVCAGIANYFDVPVKLVRILVVLSIFFGLALFTLLLTSFCHLRLIQCRTTWPLVSSYLPAANCWMKSTVNWRQVKRVYARWNVMSLPILSRYVAVSVNCEESYEYSLATGRAKGKACFKLAGKLVLLTALRYGPAGVAGWAIKSVARRPLKMLLAVALEPLLSRAANKLAQRYKR